ncbi:MAG: ABC transporter permease [Nitrospinota bacterium]
MRAYVIRRLLQSFIVFNVVLLLVFSMLHLTGDPASLLMPVDATMEDIGRFRKEMGFDRPFLVQYVQFLFGHGRSKGVIRGDFGFSYRHQVPAMDLVLRRFPATLHLALVAVLISALFALAAGVLSAVFRNTWIDYTTTVSAMFGQSMPDFWLGLMLILLFAAKLRWLPTSGYRGPEYVILPALAVGLYQTARLTRLVRSAMLEVLGSDYIRTARSKGLSELIVVNRHALKNASIPVVTMLGLELGILLGGTVVTEAVFAWPGVGSLVVDAIRTSDYPVVQAVVSLLAFIFVGVNLVVDLLYGWLDPRIVYS